MELLTVAEVADALRISERGTYRLIRSGDLAHTVVGPRRLLVSRDQLDEYIRRHAVAAAAVDDEVPALSARTPARRPSTTPAAGRRRVAS